MLCTLVIATCFVSRPAQSGAEEFSATKLDNWHHWRGPLATGFAPNAEPPLAWDEEKNIRWKASLPGRGSATPIVWGDRVFVVTAVKTDKVADTLPEPDPRFETRTERPRNYYQFVVMCFDRSTGKLLWQHPAAEAVPHEGHHQSHSYAAGSPTTDGRRLYVSFGSWGIYCYSLDGDPIWQRQLGKLRTRLGWGEAVTPVVHGDSLFINWDQEADSKLVCLDTGTGATRWEQPRDEKSSWNTPLIVEQKDRVQVVLNGTTRIRSYDVRDGAVLWQCAGMTTNAIPSCVTDGSFVYGVSGYRGAAAVAVPVNSSGEVTDGALRWSFAKGTPYVPSPLLTANRLLFTQANAQLLSIVDTESGKFLVERERLPSVNNFYASPSAAAGRVYLVDRGGTTLVLKLADKIEVLATNRLDDPIDASPVLVGKQLFLRGERFLYCIEEK
jgi:outer membrane protein assembly factor BamB